MATAASPDVTKSSLSREFASQHYALLRQAVPPEAVTALAESYMRQSRAPQDPETGLIVVPERDDPGLICRTEFLYGASPEIAAFVDRYVTPLMAEAVGAPVSLFKDKCNEKNPGGGAFPPHQDMAAYKPFGPQNFFTAMIPLDPSSLANGCLNVATDWDASMARHPETQVERIGDNALMRFYERGARNGEIEVEAARNLAWSPVELQPGDVLLFDAFIPHHSEPNGSERSRRAFFLTYNKAADGAVYETYYRMKREDGDNPIFHVATPTRFEGS